MKLSDLKTGMRVKTRNGNVYLVVRDLEDGTGEKKTVFVRDVGFNIGCSYNEDLTCRSRKELDIVEVFNFYDIPGVGYGTFLDLDVKYRIWKREEKKYYLKHKYLNRGHEDYLNEVEGEWIELSTNSPGPVFKTKFTTEDISRLEKEYGLKVDDFKLVEVGDKSK